MDGEKQIQKAYAAILSHDFEQAIEWFEQAIELEPDNAAYHYKLSITYARGNKLAKAIEHARTAAELARDEPQYRYHLQILQAKKLIQQAEKYFDPAKEQLHLAVTLLKQAVELDPLATEGFLLLGLAYDGLEEYHLAIQAIREMLKLDPQHEIGLKLLQEYKQKLNTYLRS